jgi:hypothetical protein
MSLLLSVVRWLGSVRQCAFLFSVGFLLQSELLMLLCVNYKFVCWVRIYVGFPNLMLMWLYVGLWFCDMLFLYTLLPVVGPSMQVILE